MSNLTGVRSANLADAYTDAIKTARGEQPATPLPKPTVPAPRPGTIPELSDTEAEVARARAAADAAQAALDSAEFAHEQAIAERLERREREEDARITDIRDSLSRMPAAAAKDLEAFHTLVVDGVVNRSVGSTTIEDGTARPTIPLDTTQVLGAWASAVTSRAIWDRARTMVLAHDASRSAAVFNLWDQRVAEWGRMIDATLSYRHNGFLQTEEDDLEALAAVNAEINEQSKAAPRPLNRDPADRSTPSPEQLGVPDPMGARSAQIFDGQSKQPLNFAAEFDNAVVEGAQKVALAVVPARTQ